MRVSLEILLAIAIMIYVPESYMDSQIWNHVETRFIMMVLKSDSNGSGRDFSPRTLSRPALGLPFVHPIGPSVPFLSVLWILVLGLCLWC